VNASDIKQLFSALAERFEKEKEQLGDLDAVLGDGDHGVSMANGFSKANEAVKESDVEDVGQLFQNAGRALMSGIGGASGPLFAMVLIELGKANLGQTELALEGFREGVTNAAASVQRLGKAERGDKTMLDVLLPVSEALQSADSLEGGLEQAARVSENAAEKTADLAAKKGRAQYVKDAGLGHPDPGATSLSLLFDTFYQVYKSEANT